VYKLTGAENTARRQFPRVVTFCRISAEASLDYSQTQGVVNNQITSVTLRGACYATKPATDTSQSVARVTPRRFFSLDWISPTKSLSQEGLTQDIDQVPTKLMCSDVYRLQCERERLIQSSLARSSDVTVHSGPTDQLTNVSVTSPMLLTTSLMPDLKVSLSLFSTTTKVRNSANKVSRKPM